MLANRSYLWRRSDAETLELSAFSARCKTGARKAETAVCLKVIVSHLSKTASVQAHYGRSSKKQFVVKKVKL